MDVVTTYLYGSLDSNIYTKLLEGFNLLDVHSSSYRDDYSIKLNKSLYGLKQFRRMWYNRRNKYLIDDEHKNTQFVYVFFLKDTKMNLLKLMT